MPDTTPVRVVYLPHCPPGGVSQGSTDASGLDLRTAQPVLLDPGESALVPTGVQVAIPTGWTGLVCPRSGLALRHGVSVLNAPGVIDPDYRGEVGVLLVNHGDRAWTAQPGDRVAQLVVVPTLTSWVVEDSLEETDRGGDGWGSTGVE